MTKQRSFKERIRARMDKTGESYTTARRQLIEKAEAAARKAATPKTISGARPSDELVESKTGRVWDEWFTLLDKWGAKDKGHTAMARWLTEGQGVDGWWAQSITVAYERDRGLRAPGQRSDGTYSVTASKTVNVPISDLFAAFEDPKLRKRWLGDHPFEVRSSRPNKSMTARWGEGTTRLTIGFEAKNEHKSQVALADEKIADASSADELKKFWRTRMGRLKEVLEGGEGT